MFFLQYHCPRKSALILEKKKPNNTKTQNTGTESKMEIVLVLRNISTCSFLTSYLLMNFLKEECTIITLLSLIHLEGASYFLGINIKDLKCHQIVFILNL